MTINFTQAKAEVVGTGGAVAVNFTRVCLQILAVRTATFGYTQMINPDVFPFDISYNSVGSIRFATDVTIVDSGDDQRVSRWDQPLQEYDVAYGVRTMEQLSSLIAFFRAMRGRLLAFCYQDHLDYTSSVATQYEARLAPPITALDQLIGIGDGANRYFVLSKAYKTASQIVPRPITRPQPGTVLLAIDGAGTTDFTVDNTTGVVTFPTPPAISSRVTAGFKFYVPVRFDTDTLPITLENYGVGSSNSVKLIEVRPTSAYFADSNGIIIINGPPFPPIPVDSIAVQFYEGI